MKQGAVVFGLMLFITTAGADPVLEALTSELKRTEQAWEGEADAPYFLSYRVNDSYFWSVTARHGALASSNEGQNRHQSSEWTVDWLS